MTFKKITSLPFDLSSLDIIELPVKQKITEAANLVKFKKITSLPIEQGSLNLDEVNSSSGDLMEAKRYVRRYYMKPQNKWLSNKDEVLKALIDHEDEDCIIYTLNNLGDIKDQNKLTSDDIIYYYEDGILYDKNHVRIMDYELSIKHEEERAHINPETASDAKFADVYKDRMTGISDLGESKSTLTEGTPILLANGQPAKTFGISDPKVRQEIKETAIRDAQFALKHIKSTADIKSQIKFWSERFATWSTPKNYIDYYKQYFNNELDKSGIRTIVSRTKKRDANYHAIKSLSPEQAKEAVNWLEKHTKGIKFSLPTASGPDPIINRLSSSSIADLEKIDSLAEKTYIRFKNWEKEFFNDFPDAEEGKDFIYRSADSLTDHDSRCDLWRLAGTITFDTEVKNAPESVFKILEVARQAAQEKGNYIKSIDDVIESKSINSYYFCWDVLKLFNNDFNFYKTTDTQETNNSSHELDLHFDAVNAYGEPLKENKNRQNICCICGEEIDGYGNNPEPYHSAENSEKCCDACNLKFVIPARLNQANTKEAK